VAATLLVFNTAERLLRGDFFHCASTAEIARELAVFPADWPILGLGTTNRLGRHGELMIAGPAGRPSFRWVDPVDELHAIELPIDDCVDLPFAAVVARSPDAPCFQWQLGGDEPLFDAIEQRCESENLGLAALEVNGSFGATEHQVMCDIPIGGVRDGATARASLTASDGLRWQAAGLFAANETIRLMLAHGSAAVHLHGHVPGVGGGHLNAADAHDVSITVWPVPEMVLRIRNLAFDRQPLSVLHA
jgi:hypothetical protein